MRFLLKAAFWLTIVVLLLPQDAADRGAPAAKVAASEAKPAGTAATSAAKGAMWDLGEFCLRQPSVCATGAQAASAFGHLAQAAARSVSSFLGERLGATGSLPAKGKASEHTLTPTDLAPSWRGPEKRKGA